MTQNGSYEYYNKNLVSNKDTVLNKKKYNESPLSNSSTSVNGGIRPTGKILITDTGETNVTPYSSAQVYDSNLKPENIKQGVRILGTTGTMKGYVEPSGKYIITNTQEVDVSDYKKAQVVDENLKAENIAEGVEVLGITGTMKGAGVDRLKNLLDYTGNSTYMFYNKTSMVSVPKGIIEYNDTENVTNMESMFENCSKLQIVPELNTSKVTNTRSMFENCTALETIHKIDTNNVILMDSMFYGCYKLTKIEITRLYGVALNNLYANCYSLKTAIIRSFDPKNYSINSNVFSNCYHIVGTKNSTYNPNGDKDGFVYVPRAWVDTLKNMTNWTYVADQIKPIFDFMTFGNGTISEIINSDNETILNAIANSGSLFKGWYKGFVETVSVVIGSLPTTYETPQVTYPFELNENGYYQNTNQKQKNTFSKGRFNFNIENENQKLKITYLQSSEYNYDYGVIGKIDTALADSTNTSGYTRLQGENNTTPKEIIIEGLTVGNHFIDIKYIKDSGGDSGTDTLQVKVEVVNTELRDVANVEDTPYSVENEINIGVVDETTMDVLSLVAIFE